MSSGPNEHIPPFPPHYFDEEDDRVVFHVSGPKDAVVPILERCANSGSTGSPAGPEAMMAQMMSTMPPGGMLGARVGKKKPSAVALRLNSDWEDGRQVVVGSLTITDVESGEQRLEVNLNMRNPKPEPPVEEPENDPTDLPPIDEASAAEASGEPKVH
jgi:hypothetical protein